MRYLITGGAGFVGSHLAEGLCRRGHEVLVLDDLSTGRASNLESLHSLPGFAFTQGSAADLALVQRLLGSCDAVFHLAASVGVQLVLRQGYRAFQNNLEATRSVLAAATLQGKRLIYASSSEVYGKSRKVPFSEDDDLELGPVQVSRWGYACSKAMGEWLALASHRETGVAATVLRLFNTVGPRQLPDQGMVLPRLVGQALRGEPLTVHGSGLQTRCFAHVLDVVEMMLRLVEEQKLAATGEVFNLGSDFEVSILELAELVREVAGSSSRIKLVPYGEAYPSGFVEIPRRVPDLRKIRGLLGEIPLLSLEQIVADSVEHTRRKGLAELPGVPMPGPDLRQVSVPVSVSG